MDKKQLLKDLVLYFLLLLIIPISLYINFFIADKTLWSIYIKAWIIYSGLIILSELFIIIFFKILISKLMNNFSVLRINKDIGKFIKITIIAFLFGNIFFLFPIHQKLFYYTPLFQGILIFIFLNTYLKSKAKMNWKERLFTFKKDHKAKSNSLIILISVLILVSFNIGVQYAILSIYNPHIKSLEYKIGPGFKIRID